MAVTFIHGDYICPNNYDIGCDVLDAINYLRLFNMHMLLVIVEFELVNVRVLYLCQCHSNGNLNLVLYLKVLNKILIY